MFCGIISFSRNIADAALGHRLLPHAAALLIDWALAVDGGMKFFAEKFGRTPTRTGLKERFPMLRVNNYLVVKPEIVGPNFKEFTNLYNQIFGIGK